MDDIGGYVQLSQGAGRHGGAGRGGARGVDWGGARDGEAVLFSPLDRCNGVYLSLMLCGAGFLLPYNSFLMAVDYYQQKFPGSHIVFHMSLLYICVAFLGVLTNNLLVDALRLRTRVTFGYVITVLVLGVTALCDVYLELFPGHVSYVVTLTAVGCVAFASTVQQSSFYGYTSMMPARYTQAVMTGESFAGVLVSTNRIVTKAVLPDSPLLNTLLFFLVSIALLLVCAVAFHVTRRTHFVRYHLNMCKIAGLPENERGFSNPCHEQMSLVDILDGQSTQVVNPHYGVLRLHSDSQDSGQPDQSSVPDQYDAYHREIDEIFGDLGSPKVKNRRSNPSIFRRNKPRCSKLKAWLRARYDVSHSVYPYMLCIAMAYFVTLSLFPGIESEVTSCRLHSWMPIILMAVFNFTDFIGKIIASIRYNWPRGRLLLLTSVRLVLVPLMMLCVMPRASPVLQHEAWSLSISALLGLSNGYFGSVPMILAPSRVTDSHREITGNLMTLSYSLGLTSGSAIAYGLDALLGPVIPHICDANHTSADVITPSYTNNSDVTTLATATLTVLTNTTRITGASTSVLATLLNTVTESAVEGTSAVLGLLTSAALQALGSTTSTTTAGFLTQPDILNAKDSAFNTSFVGFHNDSSISLNGVGDL